VVGILLLLNVVNIHALNIHDPQCMNIHALWIYELLPSSQCGIDVKRRDFEAVAWPWISAVVNVYLPLLISALLAVSLAIGTF